MYRDIERFRKKYAVEDMCKVLGVFRSGYYAWRNRTEKIRVKCLYARGIGFVRTYGTNLAYRE